MNVWLLPEQVTWAQWGKIFLEEALWRPVVERICRDMGLAQVETVEAGYPGTCAVFVVNGAHIVKIYPPMLPLDAAKEQRVYHLLHGRIDLLPTLLGSGVYHDRTDWPYLVLEFCRGSPIRETYTQLDAASKTRIAQQLGETLRIVHATSLVDAPPFNPRAEQWVAFLRRRQIDCVDELRQAAVFTEPLLQEIATFVAEATGQFTGQIAAQAVAPALLHADLTEDHLLLYENMGRTWQASALLDWADAEVGAPTYEWIPLWFGLCNRDQAFFRAVLRSYDPHLSQDENFYRECLAYTFLHRFGPGIIKHVWRGDGCPTISSLSELQRWLWPSPHSHAGSI